MSFNNIFRLAQGIQNIVVLTHNQYGQIIEVFALILLALRF